MMPRQLTVFIHVDFCIGDGQIRHWPLGMIKQLNKPLVNLLWISNPYCTVICWWIRNSANQFTDNNLHGFLHVKRWMLDSCAHRKARRWGSRSPRRDSRSWSFCGDSRFFVSNPETWAAHAPLKVVVSCYVYYNMIYDKRFLIHDK